jgi:glycosyltransferase involved in cell wall biosynthesis
MENYMKKGKLFISLVVLCRDDETVIGRFLKSVTGDNNFADEIIVVDTGSVDGTMDVVRSFPGVRLEQMPWPEDFGKARTLAAAKADQSVDVVVNLDSDEVLVGRGQGPVFREAIEDLWARGVRMASFRYVYNYDPNGNEITVMPSQRVFDPKLYKFVGRSHECIHGPTDSAMRGHIDRVTVGHHPKNGWAKTKHERDIRLLQLQCEEDPSSARWVFYLGREYMIHGRYADAVSTLNKYLGMSNFMPERQDARLLMAESLVIMGLRKEADEQFLLAHLEYPSSREAMVSYMRHLYTSARWAEAIPFGEAALAIPDVEDSAYGARRDTSNFTIRDTLAICYWKTGRIDDGRRHAIEALLIKPDDPRVIDNLKWFKR